MIYPCMTCKQPRPCDREHCLAYQLMAQHNDELKRERERQKAKEMDAVQTDFEASEKIRKRYRRRGQ